MYFGTKIGNNADKLVTIVRIDRIKKLMDGSEDDTNNSGIPRMKTSNNDPIATAMKVDSENSDDIFRAI
jgi:hypothetical protein